MLKIFRRRRPPVGARPGSLVVPHAAVEPRIHVIRYDRDTLEEEDVSDVEILEDSVNTSRITWIDVQGCGDEAVMQRLKDIFRIHPLVMEDIVHVPQRPKTEPHDEYIFSIARMIRPEGPVGLDIEQISIVFRKNVVLTFQEKHGDVLDPVRSRLRSAKGHIRRSSADYLAYAILDTIVDAYFPVLEGLGDFLEGFEEEVLVHPVPETLRTLNRVKNSLLMLRRTIWPQREAVGALLREECEFVQDSTRIYFRDTYDHCIQAAEITETYREMVSGLTNTYLSAISNRMNEVMKVLTIMATIFIPLTFLAGIYGMNFERMPELHFPWAYPALLAVMVVVAVLMIIYFHRKGWIGGGGGED